MQLLNWIHLMKIHIKVGINYKFVFLLNNFCVVDSTLIMQLLRDNLTLWTTDMPGDNDNAHNEVQDVDDEQK